MSSPFQVVVDGQTPNSWSAILDQFADASIYQTWAYGEVRWGARNLSHLVLKRGETLLAAAQLRIAKLPLLPAGIAYLRWGPLCRPKGAALDPAVLQSMFVALRNEYSLRRGLTLQLIPAAFDQSELGTLLSLTAASTGFQLAPAISSYRTVLVALDRPAELIRKQLDQKWRNQLNRSEKNGLELEVTTAATGYAEFLRLYEFMFARKQFDTAVDAGEFGRIQATLPAPQKMHVFLARKDGVANAALVVSLLGDAAIYLLGATNDAARELKAAYFLHWQAMLWLKERGAQAYDLGGIDPEANPGGYHFKSGFGGAEVSQAPPVFAAGGFLSRAVAALAARRRRVLPRPAPPAAGTPDAAAARS